MKPSIRAFQEGNTSEKREITEITGRSSWEKKENETSLWHSLFVLIWGPGHVYDRWSSWERGRIYSLQIYYCEGVPRWQKIELGKIGDNSWNFNSAVVSTGGTMGQNNEDGVEKHEHRSYLVRFDFERLECGIWYKGKCSRIFNINVLLTGESNLVTFFDFTNNSESSWINYAMKNYIYESLISRDRFSWNPIQIIIYWRLIFQAFFSWKTNKTLN